MRRFLHFFFLLALAASLVACGKGGSPSATVDEHGHEVSANPEGESAHPEEEEEHVDDIVLTAEAIKIAGIETGLVVQRSIQQELSAPGAITTLPEGRAVVTPPVSGQVLRIHVKPGDRVRAGQPIATLRSGDLAEASARIIQAQQGVVSAQAAVNEARAEIDLASAKLRTARQLLARQQSFAKTGAFSQPALQAAQKEVADAEAELERGKQDQAIHVVQLERAEKLYKQELISRTELEQARLEVATDQIRQRNAERGIELAKAAYERERKIADQGLSNSREIQAAEAEVRNANLEVEQARIRLNSAASGVVAARKGVEAARVGYSALAGSGQASGGSLVVKAPIGGIVVDLEATLGQAVERTTELCEIENLSSVLVVAQVSDKQVGLAKVGSSAQVSVSGYPNRSFSGVIQVVGSRLDPKTRSLPVHVLIDNAGGLLRNGMAAMVRLGVGSLSAALVVPRSAIVEDGDVRKLYIAEDGGKFEERTVTLGSVQGDVVAVMEGVSVGDRIVTKGAFVLKSEKVKSELKGHDH